MKIVCVGRNYAAHIEELENERPENPVLFLKPSTAVLPTDQDFQIPDFTNNLHYEVEVLVKINNEGKNIDPKSAHQYYDQIGLGIDFTARDVQQKMKEKGLPWEVAKAFDNAAVIGDFISKNQFKSMEDIPFSLKKNGEIVQDGNTSHMLWKVDELIAYISTYFTLHPGDIIFTGTPAGVGQVFNGDKLEGFIEERSMFTVAIR
ncbi:MAG TPA: fumarylacetoacetate hydrolase family protein [Flavobacteriaceae bacterium]|nr:fumarylacetoacetate hydrolase family protein [Flavobacteriaceae bacterium]